MRRIPLIELGELRGSLFQGDCTVCFGTTDGRAYRTARGPGRPALLQATTSRVGSRQSGCFEQSQLLKRRDAIVQADLFHNLTFLEAKHGRTGETHF
jgi:hypothetical protein